MFSISQFIGCFDELFTNLIKDNSRPCIKAPANQSNVPGSRATTKFNKIKQ